MTQANYFVLDENIHLYCIVPSGFGKLSMLYVAKMLECIHRFVCWNPFRSSMMPVDVVQFSLLQQLPSQNKMQCEESVCLFVELQCFITTSK